MYLAEEQGCICANSSEQTLTGQVEKSSTRPRLEFQLSTPGLLVRLSTNRATRPSREQAVG